MMILMRHDSIILIKECQCIYLMTLTSYNAGKVDEGNSLWIFCPDTIAIGMSNVDVHIETLGNIGRILDIIIRSNDLISNEFDVSNSRED